MNVEVQGIGESSVKQLRKRREILARYCGQKDEMKNGSAEHKTNCIVTREQS